MLQSIFMKDDDVRLERIQKAGASMMAVIEACGYTEKVLEQRALAQWAATAAARLGPAAAECSTAKEIREGQLIIEVKKAAWRHRLALEVPALVRAINDELGSEAVTSIRLM